MSPRLNAADAVLFLEGRSKMDTHRVAIEDGQDIPLSFSDPVAVRLRRTVREFVDAEVMPGGDAWETLGTTPHAVFQRLGAVGLLGLRHTGHYGGSNLGPIGSVVLAEELSRSSFGGFAEAVLIHTDMSTTHIAQHGTPDQKQRYLPDFICGNRICAVSVTEAGAGSDVASMAMRAERDGADFILTGSKTYVTNALHGDVYIVAARTNPAAKSSRGISLFIVERAMPGLTIAPMAMKHGMRSSDMADLHFDGMRLPSEQLLGEENRGFHAIMEGFQNERLVIGAMCVGMGEKAIDLTIQHLKHRKAFGGTLWDLQAARHRMAMLAAQLAAARALIHETAANMSMGEDCTRAVSMAKALSGEVLQDIVRGCLQLHGGLGYMHGQAIERIGRDARLMTIGGGATEVMLDEVAKRL